MKVYERIVLSFVKQSTNNLMDPIQFAYRAGRSVDDAVSLLVHNVLQHLDSPKKYARILFIDFSSAFNTIVPSLLHQKLLKLNLDPLLCKWILNFLTNRKQYVTINGKVSPSISINTGAPQGCVLSPLLFTLYTNECQSQSESVKLFKFSDDSTLLGFISNDNESFYLNPLLFRRVFRRNTLEFETFLEELSVN